jgi:hypothetical protein
MAQRSDRLWDKSDRQCEVCKEWFSPIRKAQRYCPPPKRCRYTNKARVMSRQRYIPEMRCRDCEETFTPRASNQVTCGMKCPGKKPIVKRCANAFCDQKFTVARQVSPDRQMYCSRGCHRKEEVFRKYHMTSRDYVKVLKSQQGKCIGCDRPAGEQRLHVDHDRNCCDGPFSQCGKCVRGLLHLECSITEDMFKDDPERLFNIWKYTLSSEGFL